MCNSVIQNPPLRTGQSFSGEVPTNMMTTDTDQQATGQKVWRGRITVKAVNDVTQAPELIVARKVDDSVVFEVTSAGNIGLGPDADYQNGHQVFYLPVASSPPTGGPSSGVILWVGEEDGLLRYTDATGITHLLTMSAGELEAADGVELEGVYPELRIVDGVVTDVKLAAGITFSKLAAPTGDFDMAGHKITGVGVPVSDEDAVTKGYVDGLALGGSVPISEAYPLASDITAGPAAFNATLTYTGHHVRPGQWLAVGLYNLTCEFRLITNVVGNVLTFAHPFLYDHSAGDICVIAHARALGDIRWWGARPIEVGGDPIDNSTAINRAFETARFATGANYGVSTPRGTWGISSGIYIETDCAWYGGGANHTKIIALQDFDWGGANNPEVFLVTGRKWVTGEGGIEAPYDGNLWGGPTTRAYIRDMLFSAGYVRESTDGPEIGNPHSRGLYFTFQQPCDWQNVRIEGFGEFGLALGGQQVHLENVMILDCARGLWCRGFGEVNAPTLNIENCWEHHIVLEDCKSVVVSQLHLEGAPEAGLAHVKADELTIGLEINGGVISGGGDSPLFQFDGGTYALRDIYLNVPPEAIALLDTGRGVSKTAGFFGKEIKEVIAPSKWASPATPPALYVPGHTSGDETGIGSHSNLTAGQNWSTHATGICWEGSTSEGTAFKGTADGDGGTGFDGTATADGAAAVRGTGSDGGVGVHAAAGEAGIALRITGPVIQEFQTIWTTPASITNGGLYDVRVAPCVITIEAGALSTGESLTIRDRYGCDADNPITITSAGALILGSAAPYVLRSAGSQVMLEHNGEILHTGWCPRGPYIVSTDIQPGDIGTDLLTDGAVTPRKLAVADHTALAYASTVTWNLLHRGPAPFAVVTLEGNATLSLTNLTDGHAGTLIVRQDATGGHTLLLPGGGVAGGSATTAPNSATLYRFWYDGTVIYWQITALT